MTDKLMTLREAAEVLSISERTAYQMARESRLAGALKVGGAWRVDPQKLHEWIRARGANVPDEQGRKDG